MNEKPVLIEAKVESWEDGPAYDVYVGDEMVGRVVRHRHTYRTTYTGSRIGYDRTHWCWWGEPSDPFSRGLRCYRTRAEVVELLVRRNQE